MSNFNFPGEGKDGSNFDTKQALRTGSRRTDKACGEQKKQFYNISINDLSQGNGEFRFPLLEPITSMYEE